jgi:two-component system response regulator RegA
MSESSSILLVDDDAVFRDRLARALTVRGCRVVVAGDARTASALWSGSLFAGAVLDLRLVETSGLQLIPEFKARHPDARVIVLTGFGSIGTAMEAGRLGAAEYLTKPVDVDRLLAALRGEGSAGAALAAATAVVPTLESVEWEHIQRVLADCGGNVSRTARLLGIDRRSLQRKLSKYPPPR